MNSHWLSRCQKTKIQQTITHMSGVCSRLLFLVYCPAAEPRSCSCTPRPLILLWNPSQSLTPAWARRGWSSSALKLCEQCVGALPASTGVTGITGIAACPGVTVPVTQAETGQVYFACPAERAPFASSPAHLETTNIGEPFDTEAALVGIALLPGWSSTSELLFCCLLGTLWDLARENYVFNITH